MNFIWKPACCLLAAAAILAVAPAHAGDLKITLPRRSTLTPVQRLNRDGVEAVRKHRFDKAESFFYKAYLYDPGDPFTLNNLGYVAELEGQFERAQKFYSLATKQASDAVIDLANSSRLRGKPMSYALNNLQDVSMRVNRANVEAISLLSKQRAPEAETLLRETLKADPANPFTLNNLGVALETEGDLDAASRCYSQAARIHSQEPVIVTLSPSARGRPVSEVAADSAKHLSERMRSESVQARAAQLNLRGVSAVNRNNWPDAERDFRQAYALDPNSAFSLNNIGYVSEKDGDLETAQFFYEKAQRAGAADTHVHIATRRSAEGLKVSEVANESEQKAGQRLTEDVELRRKQSGPIKLRRRDNKPIDESEPSPPVPTNQVAPASVRPPTPVSPRP